jgi:hypothetical protein
VVEALSVLVGTAEDGVVIVGGDAAAAIVPLRSHGFGGEPIVQTNDSVCLDQMQAVVISRRERRDDGKTRRDDGCVKEEPNALDFGNRDKSPPTTPE